MLALLESRLCRGTDADHSDAAGELRQTLGELFAIPVGIAVVDLASDLLGACGHGLLRATTLDEGGGVLGDDSATHSAELIELGRRQREPDVGRDHGATGDDCEVVEERLATITEERCLDRDSLDGLADRVDHQRRERLALNVFGDDQQRPTRLRDLLQQREEIGQRGDLVAVEEHESVLEHRFLEVGVGDEVRRQVALVELHSLGDHQFGV